jgi:hypothetical protein
MIAYTPVFLRPASTSFTASTSPRYVGGLTLGTCRYPSTRYSFVAHIVSWGLSDFSSLQVFMSKMLPTRNIFHGPSSGFSSSQPSSMRGIAGFPCDLVVWMLALDGQRLWMPFWWQWAVLGGRW